MSVLCLLLLSILTPDKVWRFKWLLLRLSANYNPIVPVDVRPNERLMSFSLKFCRFPRNRLLEILRSFIALSTSFYCFLCCALNKEFLILVACNIST